MDPSPFASLALEGSHLCDVVIEPASDGPGRIDSPWGARRIDYIAGGRFEGPRLRGRVLPGGGDWPSISNDGRHSMELDVRAVWETDDEARLYVQYTGFLVLPPPETPGLADIASLDPDAYYFRAAPRFRTGDERYAWLNTTLCVGVGRFTPGGLGYRIFAID